MACLFYLAFALIVGLLSFAFREYALFIILAAAVIFAYAAIKGGPDDPPI